MSLATAGIYFMICPHRSGAMEDCSMVRIQQLLMPYRWRYCMSASQCMFGTSIGDNMAVVG